VASLMGVMRFTFPADRITEEMAQQAYLSGYDRIPWRAAIRYSPGELVLERDTSESGALRLPWPVDDHGTIALTTGTLMERSEPYHLPLELARGEISQVRNQLADWRMIGLIAPPAVSEKIAEAIGHFVRAVVGEHGSADSTAAADLALKLALVADNMLADCYAEQALAVRRRSTPRLPSLLGANVGLAPLDENAARQFIQAFNSACLPINWREIETSEDTRFWEATDKQIDWCRQQRLTVCAGPMILFDEHAIPDWIAISAGDFDSLLTFSTEFIQAVVARYRREVNLWICAARANTAEILSLSEEEKLKIVAQGVELIQAVDPECPVIVSFDQPWGEYLSSKNLDFPPLHFADALVRADLGLSGVMLEINLGYCPGGTLPRDPLEFSRLLDHWAVLQVPIYLALTFPSSAGPDPLAQRQTKLLPGAWTPQTQEAWIQRLLPLLLAKPSVYGVFWNQLRDSEPHDFPHGGLFDLRRHPKPALRQLAGFRQTYLR
jgi:hypothetical protein